MYTKLSAPLDMQWELTPWCTYNCVYCYNYWRRGRKPKRTLSVKQLAVHSKSVQEMVSGKVFHVTLTGGEPLGVLEQVMPYLLALKTAGVRMTINTNLALLDEQKVDLLHQLNIQTVLTSLIAADPNLNDELAQTKGAHSRTIAGIRLAVANGFQVSFNMAVSQKNFRTIYETGKLAYELGAHFFCATRVSQPSNCLDFAGFPLTGIQIGHMFTELLRLKEDFGIQVSSLEPSPACLFPNDEARAEFGNRRCTAGRTSCTLGFDGSVRPCFHAPMSYGNVTEVGLIGAWENMDMWRDDSLIPSICKETCKETPRFCGTGCRIEALNAGFGLSGNDPYSVNSTPAAKRFVVKPKLLPTSAVVRLLPTVRFREESFGYIAYRSSAIWQAMDPTLHDILKVTLDGEGVRSSQIAKAYDVSDSDALLTTDA